MSNKAAGVKPVDCGSSIYKLDAQHLSNNSSGGLKTSNHNINNNCPQSNNILSRPTHSKINSADLDSIFSMRENAPVQPQYEND